MERKNKVVRKKGLELTFASSPFGPYPTERMRNKMVESVSIGCNGVEKWLWYDIWTDLVEQGGLQRNQVIIWPTDITAHGCRGEYLGHLFTLTWIKDKFALLSMPTLTIYPLARAFAKIFEYDPFCVYEENGYYTVEWDRIDPEERLQSLKDRGTQIELWKATEKEA